MDQNIRIFSTNFTGLTSKFKNYPTQLWSLCQTRDSPCSLVQTPQYLKAENKYLKDTYPKLELWP